MYLAVIDVKNLLFFSRDPYFVDVTWINKSHVQITWLDRKQSTSVYALYDINGAGSIASHYEYTIQNGWVELVSVVINMRWRNCMLWLSDYHDSIHYRDSLRLFMNKIVDCLTIWILYTAKFSSGKTFAVRVQNGHSQENFRGCMLILILLLLIDKLGHMTLTCWHFLYHIWQPDCSVLLN